MSDETSTEEPVILRAADGAWYAVPAGEFERARITDPEQLAEVRGHLAAGQSGATTLLSEEVLATHRLSLEQAAELEAAVAADTAGFSGPHPNQDVYGVYRADHNTAHVLRSTGTDGEQTGGLVSIYRVPLDLTAQRALILRLPGYGR